MKKRFFAVFAAVLFVGSTLNINAYANPSNNIITDDTASCFEQGFLFAQWVGSVTGATALERVKITLAYTEACEAAAELEN